MQVTLWFVDDENAAARACNHICSKQERTLLTIGHMGDRILGRGRDIPSVEGLLLRQTQSHRKARKFQDRVESVEKRHAQFALDVLARCATLVPGDHALTLCVDHRQHIEQHNAWPLAVSVIEIPRILARFPGIHVVSHLLSLRGAQVWPGVGKPESSMGDQSFTKTARTAIEPESKRRLTSAIRADDRRHMRRQRVDGDTSNRPESRDIPMRQRRSFGVNSFLGTHRRIIGPVRPSIRSSRDLCGQQTAS